MPTDQEKVIRKLRAILSADVKGYSLLMADDEAFTIKTLKDYRNIMSTQIVQHNGRVVDSPGDNILADFASIVDAVTCAVEIQNVLKVKNENLPDNRKLEFRIGVNIGDVVQDGDRIYGNGVNVAARIEGLADPGGVCISRNAYDHIRNKLKLGYEYLGEHSVKNIKQPVRVYKILMDPEDAGKLIGVKPKASGKKWILPLVIVTAIIATSLAWYFYQSIVKPDVEPASLDKMAYSLPDKPSIAVLPFDNLSGDPKQESLADGISESIITTLSYIPDMFVIARNSTFTYKGKPVMIRQVAEELGIRYVLEGSVLKADERIRVTAQLIDATTGYHLWSKSYDRIINDLFALLDDITKTIAIELQIQISDKVAQLSKKTDNLEAWASTTEAYTLITRLGKENINRARELTERAVRLDPEYGYAWSILAAAHFWDAAFGYSQSKAESFKKAVAFNSKALDLDDTLSCAMALQGLIYRSQGKLEEAIKAGKTSIDMSPSVDANYAMTAGILYYAGKFEEAIALFRDAMRLNPYYPAMYLRGIGISYLMAGHYQEALETYQLLLKRAQKGEFPLIFAHLGLSVVSAKLGKKEEASTHISEILKIDPNYSLENAKSVYSFNNPRHSEQWLSALRKAGLPNTPPLPLPDKPSIAVLAFDNLSGDPEQEYFSDGLSEEIISALSKTDQLFVIARNSSFTYKGKPVNVKQISRELGVRYVLEGSVRKYVDIVRVTAQLIDATTGHHLWSERYDRDLREIFAIQDEITMKIVTALQVKLTEGEQARTWGKYNRNIDLRFKGMEALSLWRKGTKESLTRYGQLAQEMIDMAPEDSMGYGMLAWYNWGLVTRGISPKESISKAFKLTQKVLSLDESNAYSHGLLGSVYLMMRQHEKAIAAGKRSIELDPNGAMLHGLLGLTLSFAGKPDEGIKYLNQGIRLNPFPAYWYFMHFGRCYILKGQYEDALTAYKKALHRAPNALHNHLALAITYALLDRKEEAEAAVTKTLEIDPSFSAKHYLKMAPFKKQTDTELIANAMRKAGFPE